MGDEEYMLAYAYSQIGRDFAMERMRWPNISSPKGSILSIDKTGSYPHHGYKKVVEIPKNKCHFVHCLPPLQEYYKNGNLRDESCRKYLPTEEPQTAAAAAPLASIALTLITILATRMHLL